MVDRTYQKPSIQSVESALYDLSKTLNIYFQLRATNPMFEFGHAIFNNLCICSFGFHSNEPILTKRLSKRNETELWNEGGDVQDPLNGPALGNMIKDPHDPFIDPPLDTITRRM